MYLFFQQIMRVVTIQEHLINMIQKKNQYQPTTDGDVYKKSQWLIKNLKKKRITIKHNCCKTLWIGKWT